MQHSMRNHSIKEVLVSYLSLPSSILYDVNIILPIVGLSLQFVFNEQAVISQVYYRIMSNLKMEHNLCRHDGRRYSNLQVFSFKVLSWPKKLAKKSWPNAQPTRIKKFGQSWRVWPTWPIF